MYIYIYMNKQDIINILITKQLKNINYKYRLTIKDIIRIASNIDTNPFDIECSLWKGAISISNHNSKYINFWFKKKKQTLHRLLYNNYIGELESTNYLKFTCENKGFCCNINHIDIINKQNNNIPKIDITNIKIDTLFNNTNNDIFIIVFDED